MVDESRKCPATLEARIAATIQTEIMGRFNAESTGLKALNALIEDMELQIKSQRAALAEVESRS